MLKAICDKCDSADTVNTGYMNPKGWADITIIGNIPTKQGGIHRQNFKKLLCPTCVEEIFNTEEDDARTITKTFEDAAADYMSELAHNAVEEAMENQ